MLFSIDLSRLGVTTILLPLAIASLLLSGAIFGFFYAYSVSVVWGLDATDPQSAIAAMQGINRVVRNAAFAPAFFGTPLVLAGCALLAFIASRRYAAFWFALAALTYSGGALLPTFLVNVPMNDALAILPIPTDQAEAADLWRDYSRTWTRWNDLRTEMSGLTLLLTGMAFLTLGRRLATR